MNNIVKDVASKLPRVPGVYLFKNQSGNVIYVGKAKILRDRVGSYFHNDFDENSKTYALVNRIDDIEYIEVMSELEALVLEAVLIKKYRPKYNIIQKDDKSYLYIVVRKEKLLVGVDTDSKYIMLPKVITVRETDILKKDILFGPYPDSRTAKQIVRALRKIFPYRDCSVSKYKRYQHIGKPCLYGYLNLCLAPCINGRKEDVAGYFNNIKKIARLLNGESSKIVKNMEQKMTQYSKHQDFENAAKLRDLIVKYRYVSQTFKGAQEYVNNPYLVSDIANMSLQNLVQLLPFLKSPPARIECYDISNLSGKEAVGSMVVATDGKINKSEYRKFKIKLKDEPDDFAMMKEVLTRRFQKFDEPKWQKPDLVIVDGGKGQVTAALEALETTKQQIPIVGLAKKEEILVYKLGLDFVELKYPKDAAGLLLLIRLRDEAHRFAQSYHHKLRLKKIRDKNV